MRCTVLTLTPCAGRDHAHARPILPAQICLDRALDVGIAAGRRAPAPGSSLELGENAHHLEQGLAGRRRGVQALLVQEQLIPSACNSPRKPKRSCKLRPRRSTLQATTTSNSRRAAALQSKSNWARWSRPLAPLMPWSL
jgi:hypothetical protein